MGVLNLKKKWEKHLELNIFVVGNLTERHPPQILKITIR
jgi:hypothetical protein